MPSISQPKTTPLSYILHTTREYAQERYFWRNYISEKSQKTNREELFR